MDYHWSMPHLPEPIRLLRPHHWIKSGFVAAPLFFTPSAVSGLNVVAVALGMVAWSLAASFIYILNDWRDRESDRRHPKKRLRPLASGTVSERTAFYLMVTLGLVSAGLAVWLSPLFAALLGIYVVLNLAYSFRLKQIALVDVMCIALGFVLRVEAGAVLIGVAPSPWIVILTGLFSLFLGFAKRRDDLIKELGTEHRKALNGYSRNFIDTAMAITLGASLVSYLIYTTDSEVQARLQSQYLYTTVPFVIFAMLRYLQIAMVEERSGSPVLIFLTDKPILLAGLGWLFTFAGLIYA